MTDPLPPGADDSDEDELAQLLLADAATESDQPGMGEPNNQPDMGEPMTAPTQPAPVPAPTPGQQQLNQPVQPPAAGGQPPAPQNPATPPPNVPATGTQPAPVQNATGPNGEDLGYPLNTPVAEMSLEQREAYWRTTSRRHEDRWKSMSDYEELKRAKESYDALVRASQTDQERAVSDAEQRGRVAGLLAAGEQVVDAHVRAAAVNRLPEQSVNALLEGLDKRRFIDQQTGSVDAGRVHQYVNALVPPAPAPAVPPASGVAQPGVAGQQPAAVPGQQPAGYYPPGVAGAAGAMGVGPYPQAVVAGYPVPPGAPDFGQGHPGIARPTGLEAGREIARARFGIKSTSQQPAGASEQ